MPISEKTAKNERYEIRVLEIRVFVPYLNVVLVITLLRATETESGEEEKRDSLTKFHSSHVSHGTSLQLSFFCC